MSHGLSEGEILGMVLPLEGQHPPDVMVIVCADGVLVVYGQAGGDFFCVDKGNCTRFGFDKYPVLREIVEDGRINLARAAAFAFLEKRL